MPTQVRHNKKIIIVPLSPIALALQASFASLLLGAAHAADAPPAKPDTALPVVYVTGEQESATGAVQGYAAKRSATGTKTDTPLLETPQSVTVIGAEQIEVLRAQSPGRRRSRSPVRR